MQYMIIYSGALTYFLLDGQIKKWQQPTGKKLSGVNKSKLDLLFQIGKK